MEATATEAAAVAFVASIVESATLAAQERAATSYLLSRAESMVISETQVGRYFWEPVDDIQEANWQNINNPQSAAWTAVATQES
jgi:hypothetical protein